MNLSQRIHQQIKRILFLASIFLFCFFGYANSSTVISDKALEKQGITRQEVVETIDNYYKYSKPDKLMACFRAVLSEPTLVADKVNFNIFIHVVVVAAHYDPLFFRQLEEGKGKVSEQEQVVIDQILKEASNFISPEPDSVSHISDLC